MSDAIEKAFAECRTGNQQDLDHVFVQLLPRLRTLAHLYLRRERVDATLRTAALVNELYIWLRTKLAQKAIDYADVEHFLAILVRQMRFILLDALDRRSAEKRGAGLTRVSAQEGDIVDDGFARFEEYDRALAKLLEEDPSSHLVYTLRNVFGFTGAEVVGLLGMNAARVYREDEFAKSYLKHQLGRLTPVFPKRFVERFNEEEL